MARRKLLTPDERQALLGIPDDEESLIRHYTLSPQDRLQAEVRRRPHNQLDYAVQLCIMRYPGRVLGMGEDPPAAVVSYVAEQLGITPGAFASYARRIPTRFEHNHRLAKYLGVRTATRDDRRAALLAAAEAAGGTENGLPIMTAIVNELRRRGVLLVPDAALEKIGLAGRAIARQQAETALLDGLSTDQMEQLEALLLVDPAIQQTRLTWLRSAPDAPSADNLIGLMDRLTVVRTLSIDLQRQSRIHPERWTQIVREGDVTPAWLVGDFGARRRRATLVAQAITLEQTLTDAAVTMFNKLIGPLFARANTRHKRRYVEAQQDTTKVLRLFRDTLRALVVASDTGRNAIDVLDDEVGWHRLLQAQPEVEAMVRDADPDPLLLAAERYSTIRKYAARFLETFTFCSSRKHDSLLAAIGTLKTLQAANRRTLPERVPVGHLSTKSRKLIFGDAGPDRRLHEIATLAVLRERLERPFHRWDNSARGAAIRGRCAMQPWISGALLGFVLASGAWGQHATPPRPAAPTLEKVELESAARPLGRLQERRARERGEDPRPTPGARLEAYLAKPEGSGPFPAIVVMPSCSGLTTYVRETLPRLLTSWGYVALVVDSLTTRKVEPSCLKDSASVDRVTDAYGGLFHLAVLPFVDRSRVGILGVAIGGRVALVLAEPQSDATVANPEKLTFKAGVAYYPTCTVSKETPAFPLLIMIGRNDQSTNAWTCEELVVSRSGNNMLTELTIYPDVHHGFLERDWSTAKDVFGARFEYNETAAEDSLRRTRDFLARYLMGDALRR